MGGRGANNGAMPEMDGFKAEGAEVEELRPLRGGAGVEGGPTAPPAGYAAGVEAADGAGATAHDAYAALRHRDYRRFAGGWFISTIGLQMQATAVGWEVYDRTSDPFALGLIGLVQAVPVIVLALPGGHAADNRSRKTVLVMTQLGFGAVSAGLAAVSFFQAPIAFLFVLLGLAAVAKAFNSPSRGALLPTIVPGRDFHNAVTWNSSAFHTAATVGPPLAGWVIHAMGGGSGSYWPIYAAAAGGALVCAVMLARVRVPARTGPKKALSLRSMAEGLGHLRREKTILAAITLDLFAVLLGGATSLMPVYAKDILDAGPVGFGLLRAAPYVGAVLMSLALAHRKPFERAGPALLWAVAGFGVATIVFGFSKSLVLSLAALLVAGMLDNISVVIRHVLVQMRTPDEVRGRVTAVNSIFIESSNELGGFESGLVAKLFGPVVSVVSGGIGTMLVVAGIAWMWPEIRKLRRVQPDEMVRR
jgi:MFS family permease